MIDRWELENGTIESRIRQVYAVNGDDIRADPTILEVLRKNLSSKNAELIEISVMRLGVRAKDLESIDRFIEILIEESEPLVRSATIAALSSLYRHLLAHDSARAREISDCVQSLDLSASEVDQVQEEFGVDPRRKNTMQ